MQCWPVIIAIPVKVSRRGAARVRRGVRRGAGGMVASQSVAQEPQNNDMYCSPYGEYYPDSQYYLHGGPPEMCPAHTGMCTVHGDYGKITSIHLGCTSKVE